MAQTAVDILVDYMEANFHLTDESRQQFIKAKALYRQQIEDAYWAGINGSMNDWSEAKVKGSLVTGIKAGGGAEQYYLQRYKQD